MASGLGPSEADGVRPTVPPPADTDEFSRLRSLRKDEKFFLSRVAAGSVPRYLRHLNNALSELEKSEKDFPSFLRSSPAFAEVQGLRADLTATLEAVRADTSGLADLVVRSRGRSLPPRPVWEGSPSDPAAPVLFLQNPYTLFCFQAVQRAFLPTGAPDPSVHLSPAALEASFLAWWGSLYPAVAAPNSAELRSHFAELFGAPTALGWAGLRLHPPFAPLRPPAEKAPPFPTFSVGKSAFVPFVEKGGPSFPQSPAAFGPASRRA